ncbi:MULTISPECIES: RidA family protein [Bradyrhizobium]|uniref:RidA family protein n=1 Tax=Bradyrhizobium elkanii TaxID=29448 RepID=UPI00048680B9|nr:RidA family protein [Bradyrhizobium elkanii]
MRSRAAVPPAQGHYVPAKRHGDLIFVSGMTPRKNGKLLYRGQVALEGPGEDFRAATELAAQNALDAAQTQLEPDEQLAGAINLTVYVNAPPGYTHHSQIADFASRHIERSIGGSLPSRVAIGVSSLPGGALVEVSLVASVKR